MARRIAFKLLACLLGVVGFICLVFPFADLFRSGGPMLILDTRAYFVSDSGAPVPPVTAVHCVAETYGTRGRSGNGPMRFWNCQITPGALPGATLSAPEPAAGSLYAPIASNSDPAPKTLTRQLPFSRDNEIPILRQMSKDGEPLVYGVIWGGKELLSRWIMWALMCLLFLAFAGGCLYAGKVGWGKSRLPERYKQT